MSGQSLKLVLIAAPDEPVQEDIEQLQRTYEALPVEQLITIDRSEALGSPSKLREPNVVPQRPTTPKYADNYNNTLIPPPHEIVPYLTVLTPLATAVGAWLQAKYGRKVRVKVGDVEAEARNLQELEKLLALAKKVKQDSEPKRIL